MVSGARGEDGNLAPLGLSEWQASKALSLAIGESGAGPQPPTLLGAFGCKWNPFLNSVNTISNCQTDKRQKGSPSLLGGFGQSHCRWEHLGVNGTHFWKPFSTRRVRLASADDALPCYWGSAWGGAPAAITLLGAFGCKLNPFLNSVNTIFNSFGANCGPAFCSFIIIVPFGDSRLGAAANDTGACRLTGIRANARLCVLLLNRCAKMWRGAKRVDWGY